MAASHSSSPGTWRDDPARVRPMLATTIESPRDINLRDPALLAEPKLDGIRGLILIEPAQPSPRITIWSRNGNDKTHQFPEVVRGLKEFGKRLRVPVMLDGEIVALTELGEPAGFQRLQGRMHLTGERDIARVGGGAGRGVHCVRRAEGRRAGSAVAAADRSARAAGARLRFGGRVEHGADRRVRGERRPPALQDGDRARVGRIDRQGRRLDLRDRPPQPRVAQAEADEAAGVRDWRLDRAARNAHALSARCSSASTSRARAAPRRCATSVIAARASRIRSWRACARC